MKSAESIIAHAQSLLETAKHGLQDMMEVPGRGRSGLHSAVMAGRSVTFALQNLRNISPDFQEWWELKSAEMKNDATLRFVAELRTKIEKQAIAGAASYAQIDTITVGENPTNETEPDGAIAFFVGDATGGSGWIVKGADGAEYRHYVSAKQDTFESGLSFPDFRKSGGTGNIEASKVLTEYVNYLEGLLTEARRRFL